MRMKKISVWPMYKKQCPNSDSGENCEKYIYSTFVSTVLIVVGVLICAYDQNRY